MGSIGVISQPFYFSVLRMHLKSAPVGHQTINTILQSFDELTRVVGRLSSLPLRTIQTAALKLRISFSIQKLSPHLQREDNYEVFVQFSGHSLTDQRNPNFFPRTMILQ